MYNVTEIQNSFEDLVSFRDSLVVPSSGRYFEDFEPLCNYENLRSLYQDARPENVAFDIDIYAEQLIRSAIANVVDDVMTAKKLRYDAKTVLKSVNLFHTNLALFDKEIKQNRFVGLKFKVYKDLGIRAVIKKVALAFDMPNPNFELYLFHSSKDLPVQTFNLAIDAQGGFFWQNLENAVMAYSSDLIETGFWYLGYYEEDLIGQAYTRKTKINYSGCTSCNNMESNWYKEYKKFLIFEGFSISEGNFVKGELWNSDFEVSSENTNFGINMNFQIECDLTNLLLSNKALFAKAIGLQVVINFFKAAQSFIRNNNDADRIGQVANYKLFNGDFGNKGYIKDLENAISNIDFDLSGLYDVCVPCKSKGNIGSFSISSFN